VAPQRREKKDTNNNGDKGRQGAEAKEKGYLKKNKRGEVGKGIERSRGETERGTLFSTESERSLQVIVSKTEGTRPCRISLRGAVIGNIRKRGPGRRREGGGLPFSCLMVWLGKKNHHNFSLLHLRIDSIGKGDWRG